MVFVRVAAATLLLAATPLLQAAQVIVGQVAPLSGVDASQGRAYAAGMQLYFNAVNGSAAAGGHSFKLVSRDDGSRPADTVAATKALLAEEKPTVLAGYFGSRNIAELVQAGLLDKEKISLIGYRVADVRPETPGLYNARAGLRQEIDKLTDHLATIGIYRLGLVLEDGPGAVALNAAADEAAAKAKAKVIARATYAAGSTSVATAVDAMLKAQPQAVLLLTSAGAAAAFIEQYRQGGGAAQLFAHSGADIEQLSRRLSEEQMQGVAIAQVMPNPYRITVPVARELTELHRNAKSETPLSYAMMEGFITAKLIVEAARRQGGRPTREGMASTLEAMDRWDAGGYVIGFKPGQHTGSRYVELSIVSASGRIRQ